MRFLWNFLTLTLCVCMVGCGVNFTDARINKNLPEDYKNRKIYPQTDIFKYKLNSLTGRILVCQPDQVQNNEYNCDMKIKRIVKPETTVDVIKPDQVVYSSKVDREASAQGSYLVFTAKMNAKQAAEVMISDSILVFINDDDVPTEKLKNYVQSNPRVGNEKRYWIQGALMATIVKKELVAIDASASGVVGNTVGLKGGVYNQRGEDSFDYRISLLMPDIDRDLDGIESGTYESLAGPVILIRSIKGLDQLPLKGSVR